MLALHGTRARAAKQDAPCCSSPSCCVALATPAPAPKPAPTNPFNLEPIPLRSSLPVIGTTRSRPICTAIRTAVGPAVKLAMQNDQTFAGFKTTLYNYTVKETESAKDLRLMQMDRTVQAMVKSTEELQKAIDSPGPRHPARRQLERLRDPAQAAAGPARHPRRAEGQSSTR